jgi:hypothetical protein
MLPQRTLRGIRRRRRAEPWTSVPWTDVSPADVREGIDVWPLVSPLRYDVLLRRDFLSLLTHEATDLADLDACVAAAWRSSYHTWYFESEVVRTGLLGRDQADLEARFSDRVRRTVALFERLEAAGGRLDEPIVLKTADTILPPTTERLGPPTGKPVMGRYFLADGCHRLAYLMLKGRTWLRPDEFRVRSTATFSPFDSTSLLMPALRLSPGEYFAFLSMGYSAPEPFADEGSLLAYLGDQRPGLADEVASVIRVDGYAKPAAPGAA